MEITPMRLVLGSDHAGFVLKEAVKALLADDGHEIVDVGTDSSERTDYPPFAAAAGRLVAAGEAERGVLMCGSGVGVAIAANKVDGVRAVNAHAPDEAEMARRHNDANVVTLSGGNVEPDAAHAIVRAFLSADFEGGRHAQRVEQIAEIEQTP
jgi:ribose 5-phosphate isomerase B